MDETIITIIILVISFLSWLFSQMKENQAKKGNGKRPANRPAQRPVELSDEIEAFLQEISGNNPPPEKKKRPKQVVVKSVPSNKNRTQKKSASIKKPIAKEVGKSFETNISNRHLEKKNLGSKLDQHVSSYMDRDVKDHVEQHISHDIGKSVSSHLGKFSKGMSESGTKKGDPHPIIALFHDRESVSKAIMLNEILSPPLSQRNKSS